MFKALLNRKANKLAVKVKALKIATKTLASYKAASLESGIIRSSWEHVVQANEMSMDAGNSSVL